MWIWPIFMVWSCTTVRPPLGFAQGPLPLTLLTHKCPFPIHSHAHTGSNAKALWANAHPMTSEELITAQAEAVYAKDPGVPGSMPRVWAYRNTCVVHAPMREHAHHSNPTAPPLLCFRIKALNWYWKIRVKLDDPR